MGMAFISPQKKGWYALKGQKYIAQGNTLGIHNQIELAKLEM